MTEMDMARYKELLDSAWRLKAAAAAARAEAARLAEESDAAFKAADELFWADYEAKAKARKRGA